MTEAHIHGTGCVNTYPDCDYPDLCPWCVELGRTCPSCVAELRALEAAASHCASKSGAGRAYCQWLATVGEMCDDCYDHARARAASCSIPECDNPTDRKGQPCNPCDAELGVGA